MALCRSTGWSSLSFKGESRAGAGGREFVKATLGVSLSADIYPLVSFTCEDAEKLFPQDHWMKIRSSADFLFRNSLISTPSLSLFQVSPPGRWTTGWSDPPGEPPPNTGCGPPGARSGLSPPGRWTTGWSDPPGEPPPNTGCGPPGARSGLSPPGRWTTGWSDPPGVFAPERSGRAPPGPSQLNTTSLSAGSWRGPLLVTQPEAVRQDAVRQYKPKSRKIKPWLLQ